MQIIATYSGHDEYVNELALQSANVFLSASEDGTVRLWDTRSKDNHIFRVAANEKLRQDSCGRGICALDAEEDFMFDYTGQHVTSVKTPLSSIYSIQTNLSIPNGMTAVAGDSPLISIFLNLGYVAFNFSAASDHTVPQ
ncbi:unnamed protein product [Gongylonema pulchrum]|uniref:Uncharacterized protein n=1 Tax=Gongylonema pulchrum TaxID=637853 RepID=A0A3P7QQQ3_9BILA|nr:unnamed protein product [Gongylonema pulchrum]